VFICSWIIREEATRGEVPAKPGLEKMNEFREIVESKEGNLDSYNCMTNTNITQGFEDHNKMKTHRNELRKMFPDIFFFN
jgi:hypothetical protein